MSELESKEKQVTEEKPEEGFFYNWNTIPNWLCFLRIALIPVFSVLFIKDHFLWAVIVMAVAALTDLFDGKIARKFNMVSNLGKALDPIADKLSQMAIVCILIYKFWDVMYFRVLLFLFIAKELIMLIGGGLLLLKGLRPAAAEMIGKVSTTAFYISMILIIALGGENAPLAGKWIFQPLPEWLMVVLIVICLILTFAALFSYVPGFVKQIKENKKYVDEDRYYKDQKEHQHDAE
ncbi:MAG: CDP-alcohol phosphatidyltransferase family protein [Eubacterium sp.]|nr:CDP-alcohol phosphatidyltransferase family protein [Eubacterium sp.]